MAERFDVIFRGDVLPGYNLADVKRQLQALFKADAGRIDQLFLGRPVTIRRNLDKNTAETYLRTLEKSGALVELRAVEGESTGAEMPESEELKPEISVAPVGADVIRDEERRQVEPVSVRTDHLDLEPPGTEVLKEHERRVIEDRDIDTSHLKVEES